MACRVQRRSRNYEYDLGSKGQGQINLKYVACPQHEHLFHFYERCSYLALWLLMICLFDLILYVRVNNFSVICWDGSSWVEPVLSKDEVLRWGLDPHLQRLESSTVPLGHCAPYPLLMVWWFKRMLQFADMTFELKVKVIHAKKNLSTVHNGNSSFDFWQRVFIFGKIIAYGV